MNYITCRYIVFFTLLIIVILYSIVKVLLLNRKCNDENSKKRNIIINIWKIIIFSILIVLFLQNVAFENNILKFENIESIFEYYYPNTKILQKFEYNEYAYIIYKKDHSFPGFVHLLKKGNYWTLDKISLKNRYMFMKKKLYKDENNCNFIIDNVSSKNVTGIFITCIGSKKNINDSISSSIYEYDNNYGTLHSSFLIINNDIDKNNYKIYIDDKSYKIFEK